MKKLLAIIFLATGISSAAPAQKTRFFSGLFTRAPLTTYYQDADGDGYGNPAVTLNKKKQPDGYVTNGLDCDDNSAFIQTAQPYWLDANHDGYAEDSATLIYACPATVPEGYTQAFTPVAQMTITDSHVPVVRSLWYFSTIDWHFNSKGGVDDLTEPYWSTVYNFHPCGLFWCNGATSRYFQTKINDTLAIGGTGNNYNCASFGTAALNGDCSLSTLVGGKNLDGFNSHCRLVNGLHCKNSFTVNVENGTGAQEDWETSRTNPEFRQWQCEANTSMDVHVYLNNVRAWKVTRTGTTDIGDGAPVWTTKKATGIWNDSLNRSGLFAAYRNYLQLDDDSLTGVISVDTAKITKKWTTIQNNWDKQRNLVFPGSQIAILQNNLSNSFNPDGWATYTGQFMSGQFIFKGDETIWHYNRANGNPIVLRVWQTLKNTADTGSVAYKILKTLAPLYAEDGNMVDYGTTLSGVHVFGVHTADHYTLFFYNTSGVTHSLPTSVTFDGYYLPNISWSGSFYYADSLTSTTLHTFTPGNSMKPFSFGTATVYLQ